MQKGAAVVTIGIVVLNYQTWELSLRCMESVQKACGAFRWRIYLVDNASKRAMPSKMQCFLTKEGTRACFLKADENRGYASGNNLGIARALEDGCGVIVVANNDIVFKSGAIEAMAVCLLRHPKAGIVGPMVVGRDGSIQQSCCSMRTGMWEIFQIYTVAKKNVSKEAGGILLPEPESLQACLCVSCFRLLFCDVCRMCKSGDAAG